MNLMRLVHSTYVISFWRVYWSLLITLIQLKLHSYISGKKETRLRDWWQICKAHNNMLEINVKEKGPNYSPEVDQNPDSP